MEVWNQQYDPFGNIWISALVAAVPLLIMMIGIGFLHVKAHYAALLGLAASLLIAITSFGMPGSIAGSAALYGAAFGLLPIGWLILNVLFLYRLTEEKGLFKVLQDNIAGITDDRRLQLLLIAFCFGAFFEGCAGFGAPVAITAAMLVGLGFRPLTASCLALIANTAPVAFGSLGTPIIALAGVTGLPLHDLSAMVGRQLPFFSVIVPFWLIAAFAGWKGMKEVWPATAVAGISFAIPQFLVSNYHGPWLVDIVSALVSIGCLVLFLRIWQPANVWRGVSREDQAGIEQASLAAPDARTTQLRKHSPQAVRAAWTPWAILCVFVFIWGLPQTKELLDGVFALKIPFPGLHEMAVRVPPVVQVPEAGKGTVQPQSPLRHGNRHIIGGPDFRQGHGCQRDGAVPHLQRHVAGCVHFVADDLGHALTRLCDPLFGDRQLARPCFRQQWGILSLFRDIARVVGGCRNRIGHGLQRVVRRLAAHECWAVWDFPPH